jgi:hypothetical protein
MNRIYKSGLTLGLALSFSAFAVLVMPFSVALAERGPSSGGSQTSSDDKMVAETSTTDSNKTASGFCNGLNARVEQINKNLADKIAKLESAQTKRDQELSSNQAKWDSEIKSARDKADAQRKENFAKMEAKATTDDQKTAVANYEKSVLEAVATRRASFDAARASFRASIEADIDAHQTDVKSQILAMKTAVASAISTAQAECVANPANGPAIRQKLMDALKTARLNFKNERKNDAKVSDDINKIQDTKKTAFEDAKKTFSQSTSSARDTLKSALEKKN